MPRGFVALMGAQFVSALADNAMLIVAIAMLLAGGEPEWMTPLLKFGYIASYVMFALVVGMLADRWPKPRVMFATNALKGFGCLMMLGGVHPLLAYAVIGFGAAAYSPAKYGLMVELLPATCLVEANAWLEALTIGAVIGGTLLGGALIAPEVAALFGASEARNAHALAAALWSVFALYGVAALINLRIPDSGARYRPAALCVPRLLRDFAAALAMLGRDPLGGASLAVTSLLWGVGTVLQFVVLDWGQERLGLGLDRASMLQGVVAVGAALGAVLAARFIPLARVPKLLPVGVLLAPLLVVMLLVTSVSSALPMMALLGAFAGFFIVPMNALLQHRGVVLLNAGQSIAVQNFCENLSVMTLLAGYAAVRRADIPLSTIVLMLAALIASCMLAIVWHYQRCLRGSDRRAVR